MDSSKPEHAGTDVRQRSLVHNVAVTPQLLEAAAGTLRMLAEPTRLHLLWQLAHGPRTVTELTTAATVPRTVVSQHLAKLRLSGLVDTQKSRETINHTDHRLTGEPVHS